jgi:hypothetical protein
VEVISHLQSILRRVNGEDQAVGQSEEDQSEDLGRVGVLVEALVGESIASTQHLPLAVKFFFQVVSR